MKNDTYTSIHIEEFDIEIRETKLGREEFTRDIPNVSEKTLRNLDETGIVRIGTYVRAGRYSRRQGFAEEQDRADAGREAAARDLRPGRRRREERFARSASGVEGIVIDTQKFSRRMSLSEDERKKFEKELKDAEKEGNAAIAAAFGAMIAEMEKVLERKLTDDEGTPLVHDQDPAFVAEQANTFKFDAIDIRSPQRKNDVEKLYKKLWPSVEEAIDARDRKLNSMKRGDELRSGVPRVMWSYF